MARFFRVIEKKRGGRRTGSNLVGSLGEAVFFAALFVLGTMLLTAIVANYVAHPDPQSIAFGRGRWLFVALMGSSAVIGGGGLIWTVLRVGTSAERRSAMARQASDIDIVNETVPRPRNYPGVPPYDGLNNSPGIELAYRLPPAETPMWRVMAILIFALAWVPVVCVMTVWVINRHLAGHQEWLLGALLLPFWAVSYWSIRYFFQLFVLQTWMGNTTVEISDLPLRPGQDVQVAVGQHGQVTMKSLSLWLVCEEEATFTQGTDIRTEVREVFRRQCFEQLDFRIEPAAPFHATCTVTVPQGAMHSFQSRHNAVRWRLVVHGEAANWPAFARGFPLVVYPGEATMQVEVGSRAVRQVWQAPPAAVPAGVRA